MRGQSTFSFQFGQLKSRSKFVQCITAEYCCHKQAIRFKTPKNGIKATGQIIDPMQCQIRHDHVQGVCFKLNVKNKYLSIVGNESGAKCCFECVSYSRRFLIHAMIRKVDGTWCGRKFSLFEHFFAGITKPITFYCVR